MHRIVIAAGILAVWLTGSTSAWAQKQAPAATAPASPLTSTSKPDNVLYETSVDKGGFEKWSLTPDWKLLNGMLVNDGTMERRGGLASYSPEAADYAVEADIRVIQPQNGWSFGIVTRASDDNNEGYAAGVLDGGNHTTEI